VRVLPDPTKGSSKTRVEVTVADEAGSVPEVVGWITCWLKKTSEKKTSLFLSTVEVKRAHRRRGVAKRLLRETEYVALKLGASETSLMVLKNNAPAISLYESYGYEIDASGSLAAKLVSVISDPQRIAQHRMVKNVVVEG
jgi:ribosomal protein S18 acetylase RimI-like enzyme